MKLEELQMRTKESVLHERLLETLLYDIATGIFTWKISCRRGFIGATAGGPQGDGRLRIKINGRFYQAHRLAWFYVHGTWPEGEIDHINGDPLDNRLSNLRDVSPAVNKQNVRRPLRTNKVGVLGVQADGKRYRAVLRLDGKPTSLGLFDTPQEAHQAYVIAKRKFHAGCTL